MDNPYGTGEKKPEYSLGRLYIPDERDEAYPMSARLPAASSVTETKKFWFANGWWGNQGAYPHCVAFAWTHWMNDGPTLYSAFEDRRPGVDTTKLYCEAQNNDPWPGNCENHMYDGTSVRAGAKVLKDWGHISEYRWSKNIDEIITAILTTGPVIAGTRWTSNMFNIDAEGFIHPTGSGAGGHAYVLNGVDTEAGYFRIKNSWGKYWGNGGHAKITIDEFSSLMDLWGETVQAYK